MPDLSTYAVIAVKAVCLTGVLFGLNEYGQDLRWRDPSPCWRTRDSITWAVFAAAFAVLMGWLN